MGSKLRAVLKQVSLAGGVLQEALPPLEVEHPGGFLHGSRHKGRLFVLLSPHGLASEHANSLVREAIGLAYFRDPSLSITSCLLRAVTAGHRRLQADNRELPPARGARLSVLCLVLKGVDLYSVQVGPSLTYVLQGNALETQEGPAEGPLLGAAGEVEPALSHQRLRGEGTVALLAGQTAPLDPLRVRSALSREARWAVQEMFELATEGRQPQRLHLAVIQLEGRAESEPAPIRRLATQGGERSSSGHWQDVSRPDYRRFTQDETDEGPTAADAAQVGDRVVSFLESAGGSLRRSAPRAAPRRSPTALLRLGIVLLFLIGSLWGVRYWQERAAEASAEDALSHAEQLVSEAHASSSLLQRRRLLTEAEQLVIQAAEMGGERSGRALQLRLQRELDELNTVVRLRRAVPLADLAVMDPKADPTRLVVQGIDVFVLDVESDRVYKYLLETDGQKVKANESPVLMRKGDELSADLEVGDLGALAWVPSGGARQRGALVVLDERGFLIEYDPYRGLAALPVYGMGGWGKVQALAGYAGNLYLLDVAQRNLLWYPPGPGGYVSMAYNYFRPEVAVDVSKATDLAVDDNLYILYANGKVERYFAGRAQPFTAVLPDSPIKEGTALAVGSVSKSVYVLDRAAERIVQFSREGHFVRQLRYGSLPDTFTDLRDLAVDEEQGRLYILSGQTVYLLELPPAADQ